MRIYISGPIGDRENITRTKDRFDNVARELFKEGHKAIVPTDISHWDLDWATYIQIAFDTLKSGQVDAVYMLSGWETSKGATLERYIAKLLGIPVRYQKRDDRVKCGEKGATR